MSTEDPGGPDGGEPTSERVPAIPLISPDQPEAVDQADPSERPERASQPEDAPQPVGAPQSVETPHPAIAELRAPSPPVLPYGWSQWVPPPKPIAPSPIGTAPGPIPAAREIVARGVDLNVTMSGDIRRASLWAGALTLATLGPIAALLIGVMTKAGGLDAIAAAIADGRSRDVARLLDVGPSGGFVIALGFVLFLVVSIDFGLVAVAIVGARAAERRIGLRSAIGIARRTYWRLVLGAITVGLILVVPRVALALALGQGPGATERPSQAESILTAIVDVFLSAPFVYLSSAIVLAGATALVAVRSSWRLARRRWRLAIVIGVVNTAASYLALAALGSALDILGRFATALGVGDGLGTVRTVELSGIVGAALLAVGSLTMTIATLTSAPAVVAWLGLGGAIHGLPDPAASPPSATNPTRLVARSMLVLLVLESVLALGSLIGRG